MFVGHELACFYGKCTVWLILVKASKQQQLYSAIMPELRQAATTSLDYNAICPTVYWLSYMRSAADKAPSLKAISFAKQAVNGRFQVTWHSAGSTPLLQQVQPDSPGLQPAAAPRLWPLLQPWPPPI